MNCVRMKPILELNVDELKSLIDKHFPTNTGNWAEQVYWSNIADIDCIEDYNSEWDSSYYDRPYERRMLHSFLHLLITKELGVYKPLWFHKTKQLRYPGWGLLQVFDSEDEYQKVRMAALRRYCADQFRSHVNYMDPHLSFKRNVYRKRSKKSGDIHLFIECIEKDIKEIEGILRSMADCHNRADHPYNFLDKIQDVKLRFAMNMPNDLDPGRATLWLSIPTVILTEKVSPYAVGNDQYHYLHDIEEIRDSILDSYEVVSEVHHTVNTVNDTTTYITDFNAFE